jgi:hypothetical protein
MSTAEIPAYVIDAAEITTITQLVIREREARDQGRWQTMRDCFHADALIRITWITGNAEEFVNGSIDMARRGVRAKHRLGPVLVRRNGERAVAMLNGIIDIPVTLDDVEAQLSSHARFFYRVERRERQWKLSSFEAVYVRDELVPCVPGQSLSIAPEALTGFRKSYRLLSYVLSRNGYRVNGELPGEDQPATAAALEAESFGWAGLA